MTRWCRRPLEKCRSRCLAKKNNSLETFHKLSQCRVSGAFVFYCLYILYQQQKKASEKKEDNKVRSKTFEMLARYNSWLIN